MFVAAGTALYGYKIEFDKSKPVVGVGLVLYVVFVYLLSASLINLYLIGTWLLRFFKPCTHISSKGR